MNFDSLELDRAIIHQLPEQIAGEDTPSPILSTAETRMTAPVRDYIQKNIINTLMNRASAVLINDESTSWVPRYLMQSLRDKTPDLVNLSQQMARSLMDAQTAQSTRGLMVVGLGTHSVRGQRLPAIYVLKLEQESGLSAKEVTNNQEVVIDIEHIQSLMMNDATRVFKVGAFYIDQEDDILRGFVCDRQSSSSSRDIAKYFLDRFLGCKYERDPKTLTQRYYHANVDFMNAMLDDPKQQFRFYNAMLMDLQSNSEHIEPQNFAMNYLDDGKDRVFLDFLEKRDIPSTSFLKDTERIRSQIGKQMLDLSNGIQVVFPYELDLDSIDILETDDYHQITLRGPKLNFSRRSR